MRNVACATSIDLDISMNGEEARAGLEVWGLFLRTHARLVQRLEVEMESGEGLPLNWFDVLMQLSFAPGRRMRMHDLLPNLMLTRSGLTRRIDRMEGAGLVRREGCADDARGVVVALTPRGHARLRQVAPLHARRIQAYFAHHLTEQDLATMGASFRRILSALNATP